MSPAGDSAARSDAVGGGGNGGGSLNFSMHGILDTPRVHTQDTGAAFAATKTGEAAADASKSGGEVKLLPAPSGALLLAACSRSFGSEDSGVSSPPSVSELFSLLVWGKEQEWRGVTYWRGRSARFGD